MIRNLLRGHAASRILARLDIEARQFWLLMDLFNQLSSRNEVLDQFGRNGVALKTAAWIYFFFSAIFAIAARAAGPSAFEYLGGFLVFSGVLLMTILLIEAGNSLINPMEAIVLVHQPINGATYTAAKLMHLGRILLYLVPGLNLLPALVGLTLKDSVWWFPIAHLSAAMALGFVIALGSCSLFGWLIRFIPAKRLKAATQMVGAVPLLIMMWWGSISRSLRKFHLEDSITIDESLRWPLAIAFAVLGVIAVVTGLRSLSTDFMIRVTSLTRGGTSVRAKSRRSLFGALVSRYLGGQQARAGYAFVTRMILRDWQFRRQLTAMVPPVVGLVAIFISERLVDPFGPRFSGVHAIPHAFAFILFFVCLVLPYGNDHKGSWIMLLAPSGAYRRFAGGVHAFLWIHFILVPHAFLVVYYLWFWPAWKALLFVAFSAAVASLYLGMLLRFIEGAPFSKPVDPARSSTVMLFMVLGAAIIGAAMALQYFVLFKSPLLVVAATMLAAIAALFVTRNSLHVFATAISYNLTLDTTEAKSFYKEVE